MIELERDAPDLEDLAAYLDGRLSAERRAQVEERLLHDEDYYDVFTENVQFLQQHGQQEQAAAGGGEVVAPAAWWRSSKVIAALAVPAAIAATLVVAVSLPRLMLGPTIDDWVARLDAKAVTSSKDLWHDPDWQRPRGGSGSTPVQPDLRRQQELAFRIGTRTVDLQVALAAGDRTVARGAATQLKQWTGDSFYLLPYRQAWAELMERIDVEDPSALRAEVAELERHLAEQGFEGGPADRYKLGKWNEAGRLAALAKDAKVLAGIWRRQQIARGIPEIANHLGALEAVLEQPELDFAAAEATFSEIADALAGRG